jgi:hypothetical protein
VVGRSVGTDEGAWLTAECENKLVSDGYTWSESISTAYVRSEHEPPPPLPSAFKWDKKLLASKLREIQRTTKLRPHEHDRWEAVFGRLEARVPPQTFGDPKGNLSGYGFGHLNTSPAQLISEFGRAHRVLH